MSIGLKRGTVAVEPHSVEWEISAQKKIELLKEILGEDILRRAEKWRRQLEK